MSSEGALRVRRGVAQYFTLIQHDKEARFQATHDDAINNIDIVYRRML